MKVRIVAALAVATAVGAFAPRPACAVDLASLQSESPDAGRQDLSSWLGNLQSRLQAAASSRQGPDASSVADIQTLRAGWTSLAGLRTPAIDEQWRRIELLFASLSGSEQTQARRQKAVARVAGQAAGSSQELSRLYDNDGRASGSPAAGAVASGQRPPPSAQRALAVQPASTFHQNVAAPPAPIVARSFVAGGVAYTALKDGRIEAQPVNAQWPVTILKKNGSQLAVESVQLADGTVQKPVPDAKGLWAIEKGGTTLAHRLDLSPGNAPVRAAALAAAKRGVWGSLEGAEAAYRADAAASFLDDIRRRFPGQAAPQQLVFDAQGNLTLRAGQIEFLCRFEPTLSGWPDGVTAKGIGLSVYAKSGGAQGFTRTSQYLGGWGLERLMTDQRTNTEGGWWWLTGAKAVQTNVVTRYKRGPGGEWLDTGQRAKLKDDVLYESSGIVGQTFQAADALGEGAADLVGSAASLALASSPAYLGLVKATGGDVGAAEGDLWQRARANFWGNAAFRALGQNYGGQWYQDKLASVDMSRSRMNVGNELAGMGLAKTGAVLQGGQQFANQVPTLLVMGGGMSAIGKLGKAGQVAETVAGAYMGGQAVVGFSQSLGTFTGTLLYGDFNSPEGLASLRDFTTQALNAPLTLSIFRPALERGAAWAAGKRLEATVGQPASLKPDWTSPAAKGLDLRSAVVESIHPRTGVYSDYNVIELRLPDGAKVMKLEPKGNGGSAMMGDVARRLRVENKLDELKIPHNKALAYGAEGGREYLVVEMQTSAEGGANPVKSVFAQNDASGMTDVKQVYEKMRSSGLMPDDLGEALLKGPDGKLTLGQLFNVREAGTPEFEAACRKAEAFMKHASFVDGGVSPGKDLAALNRQADVLRDLAKGREPRDQEAFDQVARYNNVEPTDPMAKQIVQKFLANRVPIKAEELGAPLPSDLADAKQPYKLLFVGISDAMNAKLKLEYDDDARRNNWTRPHEAPFEPKTPVEVFIYKKPTRVVRVYTEGKTNPQGFWVFAESEVLGPDGRPKTASQIQKDLALPYLPTHVAFLDIPEGTVGYKATGAAAFEQAGGAPQIYLRTYKEQYKIAATTKLAPGDYVDTNVIIAAKNQGTAPRTGTISAQTATEISVGGREMREYLVDQMKAGRISMDTAPRDMTPAQRARVETLTSLLVKYGIEPKDARMVSQISAVGGKDATLYTRERRLTNQIAQLRDPVKSKKFNAELKAAGIDGLPDVVRVDAPEKLPAGAPKEQQPAPRASEDAFLQAVNRLRQTGRLAKMSGRDAVLALGSAAHDGRVTRGSYYRVMSPEEFPKWAKGGTGLPKGSLFKWAGPREVVAKSYGHPGLWLVEIEGDALPYDPGAKEREVGLIRAFSARVIDRNLEAHDNTDRIGITADEGEAP